MLFLPIVCSSSPVTLHFLEEKFDGVRWQADCSWGKVKEAFDALHLEEGTDLAHSCASCVI